MSRYIYLALILDKVSSLVSLVNTMLSLSILISIVDSELSEWNNVAFAVVWLLLLLVSLDLKLIVSVTNNTHNTDNIIIIIISNTITPLLFFYSHFLFTPSIIIV